MQPERLKTVLKWFLKADKDLLVALISFPEGPVLQEEIGFHCQQAIEKYLKGLLLFENVKPPRTHQLEVLLNLLEHTNIFGSADFEIAVKLESFAVRLRYPLELEDDEVRELRGSINDVISIRKKVMNYCQLPLESKLLDKRLTEHGFNF